MNASDDRVSVSRPTFRLCLGITLGLVLGVGGAWLAWGHHAMAVPSWGEIPLHASTSMGDDNFVVATGMIDQSNNTEGVFLLDAITGNLQCRMISPRTGKFAAVFTRNVLQDFGADLTKKPKFLLATGAVDFAAGAAAGVPGDCVVYVVDANSGNYAAYGIRWSREMFNNGAAQVLPLILLDVGAARADVVRQ